MSANPPNALPQRFSLKHPKNLTKTIRDK